MKKKTLIGLLTLVMLSVLSAFCFTACRTKVENVNLNFVVDGQTISTIETSGKEVVAIPNNPEKEGYTFDGWYWDKGSWQQPFTANSLLNAPISSDMSVYAHFDTVEYTITYTLDGGSNANPSSYNIETPTINLSDAVKVGYTFGGWYKDSSFTNKVTSIAQGSLGNIELYAQFTVNQYKISFDADGGSDVDSITQDYNTAISAPIAPTKNGYIFDGWFENGSQTAYNFSTMPAKNVSLKAKWTPIEYTINYDLVGGTNGNNPVKYTIETETIVLLDATKVGYTFDGWFRGNDKIESIDKGSIGNVDLQAHWTPIEYTITYNNTKSADNSNPTKYTIESETITFVNLEKLGYTFNGWYNGTEKVTSINKGSMGNLTLTADWTVNGYEITYHNVDGATNSNPDVYDVEDEPLTLVDASKVGYKFLGWYTDAEFNNPISVIAVGIIGDKDLYAKWEIIEYTASFKANNALVEDVIFTVETANLNEPSVPDKDGYTGEWENYTLSANNLVINAVYTAITYSITYNNTKDRPNSNPIEYNIESNTITLMNLSATGYTFNGWFNGENQVTEIVSGTFGNITLTAKWTAIEYNINYIYDDTKGDLPNGETLKVKYTIEDNFDFVTLESKTIGYSFSGWYTEKVVGTGTKVDGVTLGTTGNITVYGQWGADVYTITYHNTDGVTNTNATTYTIESEDFTVINLSKVGYTFEGWYSNNELTTAATTTIVKGSHGNLDLYAKWEKITYTLTYNLYGGSYTSDSNPASYTIEDNITLINPTQAGKFFVGWYTLAENGDLVKQIAAGTTGNITLYARWLTFESKGGTAISYTPNFSTSGVTKPTDPTKDYYGFAGWYFDEQLTEEYGFNSLPKASSTLYAKWDATKYTITYVLYDGTNSVANPDTYTVEDSVTFADPSKTGHTFNGWYSNAQFTSALVTGISVGSHGNITIYANFGINQYTISFNSNGGTSVDDITQNYATSVSAPASPAKNGYSFGGWYSDAALKTAYTFATIPAENITLYAKWNLVTYNITYNLDGGTNSSANSATYTIESATLNLAAPSKKGYTFISWCTDSSYTNAISSIGSGSYGNKELFAKWQIITYSITYSIPIDAENSNQTEYTVITPSTTLAAALMTGYTFNGWYSDSTYTEATTTIGGGSIGDITIYGKFTANKYDVWLDGNEQASCAVSFNLNGASGIAPATQNITETNTLTYPAIPTRSGYIFGGWYANSECIGEPYDFSALVGSDIVLYAKWESIGSSNSININSTETVQLSGTTDKVYKFIPLVSGNVSITSTGSIDTLGSLYKDNALLKMDDDSGVDSNFLIVYNVTAGEMYDIHVRGFSSSTNGSITLSLTGVATIAQGGYSKAGNKSEATFGASFKLPIPEAEDNYKFLGWQDSNGVMYTDGQGNSIINWNKDENSVLYSKWEKMEYTVTFITNGGSTVESVMLEYGSRLDLNQYVTTRSNYTFSGWYESASATEPYSVGTMPDHDLTLYAKWTTFALGTIKYDETKKAISVNDSVSAELFDAICLDTDGKPAAFTATISGAQTAGSTVSIRLVATSGNKTKQVIITDIKVYGEPSLVLTNPQTEYVNLNGGLTAKWFGAAGTDSFGEATKIIVSVIDGNAGDIGSIIIKSIDLAGNINSRTIENIKLYGLPVITYQEEKDSIKESDVLAAELFNAVAEDSFGEPVNVEITKYSGTIVAGKTVTLKFKATDTKGNVSTFNKIVKVYGKPSITDAENTEFRVEDRITAETLGLSALDTYSQELEIVLEIKNGTQTAGSVVVFSASAIDVAGNIAQKDISVKIYGTPTISVGRTDIKVTENPVTPIVSFNLNGGEGNIVSQAVTQEKTLKYPDIPTRSGYVFAGWYPTTECSGTPYDFALDVRGDITLYAKWISHTGTGVIDYNTSKTIDVESKNNSTDYYAFVPLVSGTVSIYSANGLSDTYGYLFDANKKQLTTDDDSGDGNNFKITYTVTAGTLYYVRPCGYNSNGVTTIYIQGATPTAGGRGVANVLAISAIDSFGTNLQYSVALKSGTLIGGTTAIYTITAFDKLGNICVMDTSPIKMYDINDIQFSYLNMASDLIKLSSKGEEFSAVAIDSFGDSCDITIEAAQEYTLAGGQIVSLYIVATDNAGNKVTSELISNIKVYDMPTVVLTDEAKGYTITEDGDLSFLFTVRDSFGQEIYAEITTEDELIGGTYINVTVTATDDAGNTLVEHYEVAVIYTEKPFVELYINDVLWQTLFVDDVANYTLPVPTDWELPFVRWQDKNGNIYTDANGIGKKTLSTYNMLIPYSNYKAIRTAEDLQNISSNMSGKYMLVNDVDMRGFTWAPIGSSSKTGECFNGILDGNGYNITNLTLSGGNLYAGLFGYSKGTISNINLINVSISGNPKSGYGYGYSGAIVAYMNGGTISNCFVSGTVKFSGYSQYGGTGYAGGIVGYLSSGTISNCRTELSVSASGTGGDSSDEPTAYAGGIVAHVYSGIIENCITNGDVTASTYRYAYSGGIVGYIAKCNSSTTKISQCASMATVVSSGGTFRGFCYSGGLIGYIDANSSSSVTVSQSYASGDVTATASGGGSYTSYMPYSYAGGVVGYNINAEISHCYALGTVKANSAGNVSTGSSKYTSTSVAGGFAAVNAGTGTIKNCYATGNVVANTGGASETLISGGFVGTNSGSLSQCIAFGNVSSNGTNSTATYYSGGFVGNNTSGSTSGTISSCYRNSNQTVSKSTNSSGTSSSYENLVKSSFYTSKSSWSTSIWVFNDGNYPILVWQSV